MRTECLPIGSDWARARVVRDPARSILLHIDNAGSCAGSSIHHTASRDVAPDSSTPENHQCRRSLTSVVPLAAPVHPATQETTALHRRSCEASPAITLSVP